MKAIKGHYNGTVVILEEPAPTQNEVAVIVEFPEIETAKPETFSSKNNVSKRFHWQDARTQEELSTSVADEVLHQRRTA